MGIEREMIPEELIKEVIEQARCIIAEDGSPMERGRTCYLIRRIGKAYAEQFKKALEGARHELTTLHGLHACDGFDAYNRAQRDGIDPVGAWDSFLESTWQIDVSQAIEAIDIALRKGR